MEENETHQCKLKKEKLSANWPRFGFIVYEEFCDNLEICPCLVVLSLEEEARVNLSQHIFSEIFSI